MSVRRQTAAAKKLEAKKTSPKKALPKKAAKKVVKAAKAAKAVKAKALVPRDQGTPLAGAQRRAFTRLTVNLLIDYQVLDQFLYDYATNISLGGVFIRSANPLPVGTKLRVQFALPGLKEMVTTWGEVAHVIEDRARAGHGGMGVRFSDLDAQQKRLIDQLMNTVAASSR